MSNRDRKRRLDWRQGCPGDCSPQFTAGFFTTAQLQCTQLFLLGVRGGSSSTVNDRIFNSRGPTKIELPHQKVLYFFPVAKPSGLRKAGVVVVGRIWKVLLPNQQHLKYPSRWDPLPPPFLRVGSTLNHLCIFVAFEASKYNIPDAAPYTKVCPCFWEEVKIPSFLIKVSLPQVGRQATAKKNDHGTIFNWHKALPDHSIFAVLVKKSEVIELSFLPSQDKSTSIGLYLQDRRNKEAET